MVQWYRIVLSRAAVLSGKHAKLQDDVASLCSILQTPPGMALFAANHLDSQIERCYLAVPDEQEGFLRKLLQTYGAEPCAVPDLSDYVLLVGKPDSFISP
jgi:hypothetical protein